MKILRLFLGLIVVFAITSIASASCSFKVTNTVGNFRKFTKGTIFNLSIPMDKPNRLYTKPESDMTCKATNDHKVDIMMQTQDDPPTFIVCESKSAQVTIDKNIVLRYPGDFIMPCKKY